MGKLSIVSLNLFVVFMYKLFFGGDVNVKQNIPNYTKPGEKFTIEIEIEKGDREGFAKWQQKLPDGFIAKSVNMEGATFSFKNQEVKVIWMALPTSEKFSITYEIETSSELNNTFDLAGKFSYIEENERKEIVTPIHKLTISNEEPAEPIALLEPIQEENESVVDNNLPEETEEIENEEANEEEIDEQEKVVNNRNNIKITRKIQSFGNGKYQVDLTIEKNGYESFGKIEEFIPPDYVANSIETKEGIFSFERNVMKVLWMTLPKEETINISYGLESKSDELDSAEVFGVFSYLNVDKSVQTKLEGSKFRNTMYSDTENILAEESNSEDESLPEQEEEVMEEVDEVDEMAEIDEVTEEEDVMEVDMVDTPTPEEITEEVNTPPAVSNRKLVENIANIPAAETSVTYRVQIAAARKEVQQQYFIERHKVSETVTIQYHEGWYKYTIGSFPVYKAARDKRNLVWGEDNKINDAFVTAYNEGIRISVQEALMISKQKWYN